MPRDPTATRKTMWTAAILLWLAGNGLRITILAVPPVVAQIRDEFGLSATQVGLLSSIPPALFAIAALAGSLLVARMGVKAALVGGLMTVALGSALRGLSDSYAALLATTIVMSVGVAIMQPIMPTTVRQWMPTRIGLGTALYTNGLLVGELVAVMLTIPFILPIVHGSWRLSFVAWSLPVVVVAVAVAVFAPPAVRVAGISGRLAQKWLPDWRDAMVWRLGLLFLCINAIYFSANAFLPIFLTSNGRPDLVGGALTALNFGQLPASFLLLAFAGKLEQRAWPYVASGVLSLVSIAGLVFMIGPWTLFWAGLLGFSDAVALIVGLTLPALLCRPDDVARTSAGTFTLSYGGAVGVAVVCGAAWDVSGIPGLAFLPLAMCAIGLAAAAAHMHRRKELR